MVFVIVLHFLDRCFSKK